MISQQSSEMFLKCSSSFHVTSGTRMKWKNSWLKSDPWTHHGLCQQILQMLCLRPDSGEFTLKVILHLNVGLDLIYAEWDFAIRPNCCCCYSAFWSHVCDEFQLIFIAHWHDSHNCLPLTLGYFKWTRGISVSSNIFFSTVQKASTVFV